MPKLAKLLILSLFLHIILVILIVNGCGRMLLCIAFVNNNN